MQIVAQAVVRGGQVSGLPFVDGQVVEVSAIDAPLPRRSIVEVRRLLAGSVRWHDTDPAEPMIPPDSWELLG